jgi:hypothetical protein
VKKGEHNIMLSFFRCMIFHDYIDPKEFYDWRKCMIVGRNYNGEGCSISISPRALYFPLVTSYCTFDITGLQHSLLPMYADEDITFAICRGILCNKISRIIPI